MTKKKYKPVVAIDGRTPEDEHALPFDLNEAERKESASASR